jgi:hypothetical protein
MGYRSEQSRFAIEYALTYFWHERCILRCMLASSSMLVRLRPCNALHTLMDLNGHVEKLENNAKNSVLT